MNAATVAGWGASILTFLGLVWGGWVTLRNARSTRTASPYEALAKRVVDLEAADEAKSKKIKELEESDAAKARQIDTLHRQVDVVRDDMVAVVADREQLVAYLQILWKWVVDGAKPPPPAIPDHLQSLLPKSLWRWPQLVDPVDPPAPPGIESD